MVSVLKFYKCFSSSAAYFFGMATATICFPLGEKHATPPNFKKAETIEMRHSKTIGKEQNFPMQF